MADTSSEWIPLFRRVQEQPNEFYHKCSSVLLAQDLYEENDLASLEAASFKRLLEGASVEPDIAAFLVKCVNVAKGNPAASPEPAASENNVVMADVVPDSPPVLEFPFMVGPFTMTSCNLAGAFNSFYTQHSFIPRPDPENNDNSMSGLDPARAGLGAGEIVFCQLSPLHRITLDTETKVAANIPEAAKFFAWAYPLVVPESQTITFQNTPEGAFLQYGGYIYFDDRRHVVGTNGISPAELDTLGLMFGRPHVLVQDVVETLSKTGRFQEITIPLYASKGATHFAWIRPAEFNDRVACPDGGFAYKFSDGTAKYFPVVGTPTFTSALVEESLDANEAWVVLRNATRVVQIEKPAIYDKTKSLEENAGAVEPYTSVSVSREGDRSVRLSYEAWARHPSTGSVVDPWIITIER